MKLNALGGEDLAIGGADPFIRKAFVFEPGLVGARWWQEELAQAEKNRGTRRRFLKQAGLVFGVIVGVVAIRSCLSDDEPSWEEISGDSLDLQKAHGWDVGADAGEKLSVRGENAVDIDGKSEWNEHLAKLDDELAPAQERWRPYYVPTLFRSLTLAPHRELLIEQLRPTIVSSMSEAYEAGVSMRRLVDETESAASLALVVDLAGEDAVAFAAGLGASVDHVFAFDNWPHPKGVVPSQAVIGAALYYRPWLLRDRDALDAPKAVAFVLDSKRLTSPPQDSNAFDNRYIAKMPAAAELAKLGIDKIIYISNQSADHELDDLNDVFVDYQDNKIEVKYLPVKNLRAPQQLEGDYASGAVASHGGWGGSTVPSFWFWHYYGWPAMVSPSRFSGGRPPLVSSQYTEPALIRPAARPTVFSSRTVGLGNVGVGKVKPSGFGRVSFAKNPSTGRLTMSRAASPPRGSWGRSFGSSGSG